MGTVGGAEEPRECYATHTTERAEKEALKLINGISQQFNRSRWRHCRDRMLRDGFCCSAQKVNEMAGIEPCKQ